MFHARMLECLQNHWIIRPPGLLRDLNLLTILGEPCVKKTLCNVIMPLISILFIEMGSQKSRSFQLFQKQYVEKTNPSNLCAKTNITNWQRFIIFFLWPAKRERLPKEELIEFLKELMKSQEPAKANVLFSKFNIFFHKVPNVKCREKSSLNVLLLRSFNTRPHLHIV